MINNGSVVRFEYTLSDENGQIIQSNKGKEPVSYKHGSREIISGLEKGIAEMQLNEEKTIQVQPEEGYGPVDPQGFTEVPKSEVPTGSQKAGTPLTARDPQGQEMLIHVREVKQDTVILDFNHPLAGKTLTFDIKVVAIEQGS